MMAKVWIAALALTAAGPLAAQGNHPAQSVNPAHAATSAARNGRCCAWCGLAAPGAQRPEQWIASSATRRASPAQ